jgi:hypothetical protein
MLKALLIFSTVSVVSFAKLSVSVSYSIPHSAMKRVLDKFIVCQTREYMEYACAERPFEDANKDLVRIGCGPNLPDKDGKGCTLSFFDKTAKENGKFRFGMSKQIAFTSLKSGIASIEKKISEAATGPQHLNLGNPFSDQPEYINYVCERKSEKEEWNCYLDVSER